jgi:hypothetical protein
VFIVNPCGDASPPTWGMLAEVSAASSRTKETVDHPSGPRAQARDWLEAAAERPLAATLTGIYPILTIMRLLLSCGSYRSGRIDPPSRNMALSVEKYRIVEWTNVFRDGSRIVAYELQSQIGSNPNEWSGLGTSPTLADARKALLFHAPNNSCGFG